MKLKINKSWVEVKHSPLNREGLITDINIALSPSDKAGEQGISVKEYDTDLNYQGSISYKSSNDEHYWAYFSQIKKEIDLEDIV